MSWFRILSACGVMALAISTVDAQDPLSKGKGGGQTKGGGTQSGGGQSKGAGQAGGGLGNQGKGGGQTGSGLGNQGKGGGQTGGGGLGNQGSGNSGQGSGGLGKGRGNQGGGTQSGGGTSGGLGNQGNQGGGTKGGLGNKGNTGNSGGVSGNTGRGGAGDQLGRIDNPTNRGQNSLGRGNDRGRLGNTNYGSSNNRDRNNQFNIGQAPLNLMNKGSIMSQVLRTEQVRVNTQIRDGYHSYHQNWRDDYFYYPHYTFSPWNTNCSYSPWYYYPHLPAYVVLNRIIFISGTSWNWNNGNNYNWNRNNRNWDTGWGNSRNQSALDESLEDLVYAFERQDRRALGRLIPQRGRINIYMDDSYAYTLNSDDFYDMMLDNIETTRTVRYDIERVRTHRGEAQVTARHEFADPWGRRSTVYHNFRLEEDRYGYSISDFRTSWRR